VNHFSLLGALLLALAAGAAPAQRSWIVDPLNPAGADFPDLPQALGSPLVVDGDVLVLRAAAGTYSSASTGKGVSIVAPSGATIGSPGQTALTVSSLPAGRHFSLRRVQVGVGYSGYPWGVPLVLNACAGSVHLDDVTIPDVNPGYNFGIAGMSCQNCSAVSVLGCSILGKPAILATNSTLSVNSSTLIGLDAISIFTQNWPSAVALAASGSEVDIALSMLSGGSGVMNQVVQVPSLGSAALAVTQGSLRIGGIHGLLAAGRPVVTEAIPAITLSGMASGSVAIDYRAPMISRNGAPAVLGAPAGSIGVVAALSVSRSISAFAISATVTRQQGDLAVLLAGMPVPPANSPLGREWLDLGTLGWLGSSVIDASMTWTMPISVPNIPTLFGFPVGLQAAVLSPSVLEVTNATVVVLGV
jgi:hypothetical protein